MIPVAKPAIPRVSESVLARFYVAVQAVHGADPVTAATLLASAGYRHGSRVHNELRAAVRELVGAPKAEHSQGRPCTAKTLGFTLRRHAGVVAAGLTVQRVRLTSRSKVQMWRVATPETHEALRVAAGLPPAWRPKPRARRPPRIPKLPVPKPDKPIIQRVVRLSPPGNSRLETCRALQLIVGGHIVVHGGRYHVHVMPRGGLPGAERLASAFRVKHPGVRVEVTDTRGCSLAVQDAIPEPEQHYWPPLEAGARPMRPRGFDWDPYQS